ncbi:MAG: hypothetical protein ACI4MC_00275 [Candidatus Coproplasma sp.]
MNRNIIFKVLVGVLFIAVSILWLLSAVLPDTFGGLNLAWLIAIFAFGMGVLFIGRGILTKNLISIRKFYVFLGVLFLVAGVCALIGTVIQSVAVLLPVIALVLSAGLLISTLFVQGKKWDAGDNQEPGYKTYRERKAEQEKLEAEKKAAEAVQIETEKQD